MENWQAFFKDKTVTVMGLGLLGRGIADTKFLAKYAKNVIVTDLKSDEALRSALDELKEFSNIKYVLGEHHDEDFIQTDLVLKNAAVPPSSKYLKIAREHNIPIEMDESLFAKFKPEDAKIIGVTGTRGKTTTTFLINDLLPLTGKPFHLAGNVQGKATLPLLEIVQPGDLILLELSSWQLQGFGEAQISPEIAIWTNLYPDHLNYYQGSMEAYANDKKNIYLYQKPPSMSSRGDRRENPGSLKLDYSSDIYIYNQDDDFVRNTSHEAKAQKISFSINDVPEDWQFKILGKHNRSNVAAALACGHALGLSDEAMRPVLENFGGVEYRLQYLGEKNNLKFYNDSTSTTPVAGATALAAFPNQDIYLIAGGSDKNLEFDDWAAMAKDNAKAIFLLKGEGTNKIKDALLKIGAENLVSGEYESLVGAWEALLAQAGYGIVLFSPACASFGMFINEYDRGEQFSKLVKEYLK
ncbi:MAG TPA: UDP-N-acetylmuramoyl-L-alanine--D-glutamate ligase [bacterium]|nr:UDP-N-acetylmuramoyl-L-alanine--D-glutamate ligase [bacterium]